MNIAHPITAPTPAARAVVAMSGGVDSSVAALLLHRAGVEVIGVSMQVWDYRSHGGCASRATCCAPDDFTDARKVAALLDVPYYVFDFENTFRKEVIDRFVETYNRGLTPNPCIDCNQRVKFRELRDRARALGVPMLATGHYARVVQDERGWHLLRGTDSAKDQSYFLYGLSQDELASTLFPIGDLTKPEVRALAREAGLVTAEKAESQDICFVSGSAGDFVARIGGKQRTGMIVTRAGKIIGQHEGIGSFTVGQRRGLGIGGHDEPWYVLEIDAANDRVIVGPKQALERDHFEVEDIHWVHPRGGCPDDRQALVQVRHRHHAVPVTLVPQEGGRLGVRFNGPLAVASPGQAAVFYSLDNTEVLGGGRIAVAGPREQI